jgi:hypothetical protein
MGVTAWLHGVSEWMRWKILGNWKILEMNKMHVLVNKNLTKMEFRRTTSKK